MGYAYISIDPQVCSQYYYRPPIQDGLSASSHSTEVPSVANTFSVWDTPTHLALRREMAELGGGGTVIAEVLNGPINGDGCVREVYDVWCLKSCLVLCEDVKCLGEKVQT